MSEQLEQMNQSQHAKRTNLANWWMNQFVELDLPSGLHVLVRDVDMEDLVANGTLPNSLLTIFEELEGLDNKAAGEKMMDEHPNEFKTLLDVMSQAALVEPKVGPVTDIEKGIISLSDLRGKDKLHLFTWLQREVGSPEMRSFREGKDKPLEAA